MQKVLSNSLDVLGNPTSSERRNGYPRDLSFENHKSSYATHSLHPFPAKFPPPLARWIIEHFTEPDGWVLDPFVGSGTSLVEACLLGRNALAAEIDPLSRLLSQVKATPVDPALVETEKERIDRVWDRYTRLSLKQRRQLIKDLPEFPNRDYWFHKQVQCDLVFLRNAIARIENRTVRDFLLIVYSSVIIAKGPSTVANALDIAHSRAHHVERPTPPDVWTRFGDRYRRALRGLREFYDGAVYNVQTFVLGCDARALPYCSRIADVVLSSPPYITAIEYPRSHKFSVWWMGEQIGVSNRIYEKLRGSYIGTEYIPLRERIALRALSAGLPRIDHLTAELDSVDEGQAGLVRRYFQDMRSALSEMLRALKPERHAVLIVADSNLSGVLVPTGTCLIELAESLRVDGARFVHKDTIVRTIRERSRQMPIKRGRNGDGMKTEEVLILQRCPGRTLVAVGTANRGGHSNKLPQDARKSQKHQRPHERAETSGRKESVDQTELGRSRINRDQ